MARDVTVTVLPARAVRVVGVAKGVPAVSTVAGLAPVSGDIPAAPLRTALGLGTAATHAAGDFDPAGAAAAVQAASQPLSANLTAFSLVTPTTYGLNLTTRTDAAAARTLLGLGSLAAITPTGTASAATFLRGDGAWVAVTGGASASTDLTDSANLARLSGAAFTGPVSATTLTTSGNATVHGLNVGPDGVGSQGNLVTAGNVQATGTVQGSGVYGNDLYAQAATAPTLFFGNSANLSRRGVGVLSLGNGTRDDASGTLLLGTLAASAGITAPTAAPGTNTTQVATTAFVQAAKVTASTGLTDSASLARLSDAATVFAGAVSAQSSLGLEQSGGSVGLFYETNCLRIKLGPATDGNTNMLQMGVSGALGAGAAYIQSSYPGSGAYSTYPLILQPQGGSVGVGTNPGADAFAVAGSARVRAPGTNVAGDFAALNFGAPAPYGVMASVRAVYDGAEWYQGMGLSFSTCTGADVSYGPAVERVRVTGAGAVHVTTADVEVDTAAAGVVLKSPDGTRYRLTVANGGILTTTAI